MCPPSPLSSASFSAATCRLNASHSSFRTWENLPTKRMISRCSHGSSASNACCSAFAPATRSAKLHAFFGQSHNLVLTTTFGKLQRRKPSRPKRLDRRIDGLFAVEPFTRQPTHGNASARCTRVDEHPVGAVRKTAGARELRIDTDKPLSIRSKSTGLTVLFISPPFDSPSFDQFVSLY